MKLLTKQIYEQELRKVQQENIYRARAYKLKKERAKYPRFKKPEMNKILAIYLFILMNIIVIYSMIAMWKFHDLSYLGILITDIASQVLIYAIYCLKAYHGKKQEENMKFEREKFTQQTNDIENEEILG